jgi:hypothetical protein
MKFNIKDFALGVIIFYLIVITPFLLIGSSFVYDFTSIFDPMIILFSNAIVCMILYIMIGDKK